ncbi:MAG: DUF3990 domain-containing protein [Bacteroidetes bacterium]|nr:DUF3990 domain-containing protein [Bacteroidota bacterium]
MIIYHGSDTSIEQPEILESNRYLDFGVGFYTTRSKEQAERWARKVCLRNDSSKPIISVYNCNFVELKKKLNVIEFANADESWLDFVIANRSGKIISMKYDVVDGPAADDNVYLTIKLFENGILNRAETLKRLKIEKLFNQISFHSEVSLQYCFFDHIEKLHRITNG